MDLAALRRWWPLAAVLTLLSIVALAATRSTPQLDRVRPHSATLPTPTGRASTVFETPPTAQPTRPPAVSGGLPDWLGPAVFVLLAVVGVVLAGLVIGAVVRDRLRRRDPRVGRRRVRRPAARTADELVAALDAGLLELSDTDGDPRRAVIACWVRLEQAAAAAGTARHPGDTPTDLVGRLLAEQQVDADVLAALAEVYRQARYATHTVDDQMRAQARAALQRLRTDLAAAVPVAGAHP